MNERKKKERYWGGKEWRKETIRNKGKIIKNEKNIKERQLEENGSGTNNTKII